MASFDVAVGTESRENSTVDAVSGSDPSFTITLDAAPTRTIVVGDTLVDSVSAVFLITAVASQTSLTVLNWHTGEDPETGAGSTGRSDANLTDAEADIGNYAASADTVEWRCYNDGTLDDKFTINDTTLGDSGQLTITSPVGERHTGTAGTGFILTSTAGGNLMVYSGDPDPIIFEFIEVTSWGGTGTDRFFFGNVNSGSVPRDVIRNCIIHDDGGSSGTRNGLETSAERSMDVYNCLFYDINDNAIRVKRTAASGGDQVYNCILRNCGVGVDLDVGVNNKALMQNCGVFGNGNDWKITSGTWDSNSDFNASTAATSDADYAGGTASGNIGGLTSSDEFVDLTGGSEDFRLKESSKLVNAGTDLSSTFTKDCIGNFRALQSLWDIGAFDWDVVVATIGNRTDSNVTISSVSGEAPEWEVTLSAAAPSAVVIGEKINDGTTDYLIRKIAGSVLTVRRVSFSSVVDPASAASTIDRLYTGMINAEADIGNIAEAGNTWEVRFFDDAVITENNVTINADVVKASGHLKVTVTTPERHNGTAGTGARWQANANGNNFYFNVSSNTPKYTLEWLELIGKNASTSTTNLVRTNNSKGTLGNCIFANLIVHRMATIASSTHLLRGMFINAADVRIQNCLIYDIDGTNTSSSVVHGIDTGTAGDTLEVLNCTINDITKIGLQIVSGATGAVVRNVAAFNCGTTAFTNNDAGSWAAASDFCATDDAEAVGGSNDQVSKTASHQFIDLTSGSENYKLRPNDLRATGEDLSSILTDDIEGNTRGQWDIGSHQYKPTAAQMLAS